ncbi:ammonium transporter [Nocardioides bizhenqiangii]|uniref:Ammonium transporter n=1 Tax=Nocardioides bizhenqiangii TaxID=3095076 RepID=A0ABZ0ZVJ6_9ACTN|nr:MULTISPECIES: ammonium transporter [unclassified Nocardioides]MDZ5623136.1 ammonium transporter [Nocardioides sp. HM23]WQQ28110.1 ammonium transporter [Nocardioides sp. HM61]
MTDSTAWLLISTALVIFMTPGLAFFYGGLVKSKSVISMMMLSFGSLGLISVLWILYGFNMGALTGDGLGEFVGDPFSDFGLTELSKVTEGSPLAGVAFGGSFAIITVALISGSIADRARFWPWMLFAGIWATIVYFPVQAWVWNADYGWIFNFGETGVLDWAGGTAVHINAGAAALALALVLGKRKVGFSKEEAQPHNVPLVLIGTAILWFGWFGFNTGLNTGEAGAGLIFLNTLGAPAAAMLGWIAVEHFREGKPTAVGAASGVVAGLVAITPACAHVTPVFALVLGLIAGVICAFAIDLKFKLGFDDTLDVVGIHLVAGFVGCWYLGFLAYFPETGLFYGANADQLVAQVVCSLAVAAFSFIVAYVVGMAIEKTIGFRAREEDEIAGLDLALHGTGYAID